MDTTQQPSSLDHPALTPWGFSGAFTIAEFCKRYSISRSLAYEEHKAGRLTFHKVGQRSLIMFGEAARWAQALAVVAK